jgi:cytochrome c1
MKKLLPLAALVLLAAPAFADGPADPLPPRTVKWSFAGPFGTYDRGALQRGFQVYKEVCAACHGLSLVAFHDLAAPGGPEFPVSQAKAIAATYHIPAEPNARGDLFDNQGNRLTRPGTLADHLLSPYANEAAARTANNGALPPDLSLIVTARRGGASYVYSLLTGFNQDPPHGFAVPDGKNYNPYFPGHIVAMPPPLWPGSVTFRDGTPSTVDNEAKAVATFLAWTADPNREARHRLGFEVMAFLALLAVLLGLSYAKIWHGKPKTEPDDPDTLSGG